MKSPDNSVIQIGAWRVDPALDEISRDGQTTKLEPKLMQLLLHLAAHAGQVVSVEQLLDEVWKDVVVTPDSVYHAVAALRRVLGDDSKDPSYIANVMRRGYRLIAPVERQGQAEACAPPLESQHSAAKSQSVKPTVELPQRQSFRKFTERRPDMAIIAIIAVLAVALAYFIADRFLMPKHLTAAQRPAPAAQETAQRAVTAFAPPLHSIAVLPLVNISGDREQEYFSEGLTEELLNSLSRINELQVAARTSSFSFQGEHPDIATVARKLNVAAVLEGSVRRSGHTVRISVQLVNTVTGFHVWSETYDRDLGDVLKLQTEIATAVASALKVSLLGEVAGKIELGGTLNPEAFDAFLRGTKAFVGRHAQKDLDTAITEYTRAIQLDPNYALAYVARSRATVEKGNFAGLGPHDIADAETDAHRAVELAPGLGEAFAALGDAQVHGYQFARADESYKRALALAPGDVRVLQPYSGFSAILGRFEAAIDAARRAVQLDPLNIDSHATLAAAFYYARRYEESNAAYQDVLTLDPEYADPYQWIFGYMLGKLEETRKRCEKHPDNWGSQVCLAIIYEKLGRHAEAESQLGRLKASNPTQNDWYQYAEIYAQWGNVSEALEFLEKAMRSHHVGIVSMKFDSLLDPVRKEPRFQAIERALKFPD